MEVGDFFYDVVCESFIDTETGRIRIRPLTNQLVSTTLMIESLKMFRTKYPIGTKFMANELKVCQKPNGRIYLRSQDQMLFPIENNNL